MANIRLDLELGTAVKIKATIQHLAKSYPSSWNGKIKYQPYCLDRSEQGYVIKALSGDRVFYIIFASRGQTAIHVYHGKEEPKIPGNTAPESFDKKSFIMLDYEGVAKYILTLLEDFFK